MAHHQQINHDRNLAVQGLSFHGAHAGPKTFTSEDEAVAELDEPPDAPIRFSKKTASETPSLLSNSAAITSPSYRKASLLTQALHNSPDLTPVSDFEAPHLTSDGGMTSPTRTMTPSPPLLATQYAGLPCLGSKDSLVPVAEHQSATTQGPPALGIDRTQETKVEETLGRKRCISFACGGRAPSQSEAAQPSKVKETPKEDSSSAQVPLKRPSIVKFACPMKSSRTESANHARPSYSSATVQHLESAAPAPVGPVNPSVHNETSKQVIVAPRTKTTAPETKTNDFAPIRNEAKTTQPSKAFNRIDFQKCEATSFYEFACSYNTEDEWTNEQTAYRKKITIMDTLEKENAIRQLAEEAEEEALEEDVDLDDDGEEEDEDDDDGENEGLSVTDDMSDDGNESDDEEGFAESDDESEAGYQFWTPGLTTAATSTDHIEHIRATHKRVASNSSIESVVKAGGAPPYAVATQHDHTHGSRPRKMLSKLPEAPNNPDEFIIGTLDEDRPLEDAYLSSLEQRKRSKHRLIPQDIDPSFPTSDPEVEDDGNESEDEACTEEQGQGRAAEAEWITGRPDSSEDERLTTRRNPPEKRGKPLAPSPKRLHSPPPRRLFGQSTHRLRSPPPQHKRLASPPSSRRPSPMGLPPAEPRGIDTPHLAQRPNLTHTTSLPRTPNPFWDLQRKSKVKQTGPPSAGTSPNTGGPTVADFHSRGPIDIVQGLERKRQRRKEKFWRIYCQKAHAGKEKERKCQPGKGAERMREVGKEMQDRFKGYGHRANLMLSV
ncbi:MAG: hypothetical protein Q9163_000017 [Psora crenata]